MRRVFLVAPNIGLSYGGGGGVKVALYMAQTLLKTDAKVHLIALKGWPIEKLNGTHGTTLRKFFKEGKLILNYMLGSGSSPRIPFPIAIKLVSMHVEHLIKEFGPDLVIFHDDIPKLNYEKALKLTSNFILYSHFPYAARICFNVVDAVEVGLEKYRGLKTRLYYQALKKVMYTDTIPREVKLVANSTVTKIFMEMMWRNSVNVLYPPLTFQPKAADKPKDNIVVLVGGQPNKRVGDAVKALAKIKNTTNKIPRLYVIAHSFVPWYRMYLTSLARKLGVEQYVYFLEMLPAEGLMNIYSSSNLILSTARFEPFGMSIIEGMAFGNIPIVYKGELSGPWMDIIEEGRYGLGFKTLDELAETMYGVMIFDKKEFEEWRNKVVNRASLFSLQNFEDNFINMIKM
jgi:hypothetical protein